jgi:hypothetical protein
MMWTDDELTALLPNAEAHMKRAGMHQWPDGSILVWAFYRLPAAWYTSWSRSTRLTPAMQAEFPGMDLERWVQEAVIDFGRMVTADIMYRWR